MSRVRWINEEKKLRSWTGTMDKICTVIEKTSRNAEVWTDAKFQASPNKKNKETDPKMSQKSRVKRGRANWRGAP